MNPRKPIAENLTINDTLAIVVSGVQADYDADSGKMQLFLPVRKSDSVRYHAYTKETTDDLSWVNLYQIQFDPSVPLSASAGLFFDDTGNLVLSGAGSPGSDVFSLSPGRLGFSAQVSLGVEEARRLKNTVQALILVRFEEPYAVGWEPYRRQLEVRLIDVLFVDLPAKKILAKVSQTEKTTPSRPSTNPEALKKIRELYQQEKDDQALTEIRALLTDEPTNAQAFLISGKINQRRGDQEAAIAALKTAIFWDKSIVEAHVLLSRIFLARGDMEEAKKYANSAISIDPNNQDAIDLQRQLKVVKP